MYVRHSVNLVVLCLVICVLNGSALMRNDIIDVAQQSFMSVRCSLHDLCVFLNTNYTR